jgi:hypothetical protein
MSNILTLQLGEAVGAGAFVCVGADGRGGRGLQQAKYGRNIWMGPSRVFLPYPAEHNREPDGNFCLDKTGGDFLTAKK